MFLGHVTLLPKAKYLQIQDFIPQGLMEADASCQANPSHIPKKLASPANIPDLNMCKIIHCPTSWKNSENSWSIQVNFVEKLDVILNVVGLINDFADIVGPFKELPILIVKEDSLSISPLLHVCHCPGSSGHMMETCQAEKNETNI